MRMTYGKAQVAAPGQAAHSLTWIRLKAVRAQGNVESKAASQWAKRNSNHNT